jgi:hypothetical protein
LRLRFYYDQLIGQLTLLYADGADEAPVKPFTFEDLKSDMDDLFCFSFLLGCWHMQVSSL